MNEKKTNKAFFNMQDNDALQFLSVDNTGKKVNFNDPSIQKQIGEVRAEIEQIHENARTANPDELTNEANSNHKTVIKLDKNFHLYVHGNRNLIERGYSKKRKKNFIKIFFDNES